MDDTLRKGCRVRLIGLSTALLNGAEGCIVGPLDEESGRHPVKLLKPTEAVTAYPTGVKVKPGNLEKIEIGSVVPAASNKSVTAKATKRESRNRTGQAAGQAGPAAPGREALSPDAWARGLSAAEQAEWFVDCYRMRVDDDYAWGGCNLHGLYDPDHTSDSIVTDFLLFCKLAVRHGVMPKSGWSWDRCLNKAGEPLRYAFEKSDAQEKYGGENVFSAMMGGRSLRMTGEHVYGTSCMAGAMSGDDGAAQEEVREEVESAPLEELLAERQELFSDVGGADLWGRLRAAVAVAGH